MVRDKFFDGKFLQAKDLSVEQNYQHQNGKDKEKENMPNISRDRPYPKFNFSVEIDGITVGGFTECSGIDSETDIIEYREGNEKTNTVRKLPGLTFYSNLILKKGVTGSLGLYNWRKSVIDGLIDRKNLSVILLDENRQPVSRWIFKNAWPCRMSGPELNAIGSDVAIEEIEICYEGFEIA